MGVLGTLETTIRAILAAISDPSQVIRIPPSSLLQFCAGWGKKLVYPSKDFLKKFHQVDLNFREFWMKLFKAA
jgi:hypothetical protein